MRSGHIKALSLWGSAESDLQAMLEKGVHSVGSATRGQVLLGLYQGNYPEQVGKQDGAYLANMEDVLDLYS